MKVMAAHRSEPPSLTVYRLLRRAVIEQALKPGTRLPEDTIGEQFGVSRTVVRQALGKLESEGLVETKRNRGAFVAEPSLEEAQQIFEIRHVLEKEVIKRLAQRISVNGLDALAAHVTQEDRVLGKNGPVSIRLAGEFHILLAEMTGNQVLARYVSELVTRCSLILAVYGRTHSSDCAVDEHRQIIAALADHDAERAMEIMDHHLGAVAGRAELRDEGDDVESVLARYGKELAS
ncbi:GntR family transcriptional regulator [Acuticoccus sediminis]|uniref:GntR family transcriptional regulator n=1 Tax=Acuticoccus sediminis TaxID=2184697 RepID=A0A8B2NYM2_9HYPH|nr:GntR family transcriptional regulator [Acuticoccus sediminis]RAI01700.1 GntR family transcriptional regulator [Acuticoccus sediminis]